MYQIAIFGLIVLVSCARSQLYDIEGVLIGPNRFINCDFNSIIHFSSESSDLIISYPDPMCQFTIKSVPRGSYLLEVVNTTYAYEPVRIEINSKGKIRARRFNVIQTTLIEPIAYPLRLQPLGLQRFFQQREQFRLTDLLSNPMVLMLILPVIMIMMIPKLANDPETKKELNQMQPSFEMPDVSEYLTAITNAGGSPAASKSTTGSSATSQTKKKN